MGQAYSMSSSRCSLPIYSATMSMHSVGINGAGCCEASWRITLSRAWTYEDRRDEGHPSLLHLWREMKLGSFQIVHPRAVMALPSAKRKFPPIPPITQRPLEGARLFRSECTVLHREKVMPHHSHDSQYLNQWFRVLTMSK